MAKMISGDTDSSFIVGLTKPPKSYIPAFHEAIAGWLRERWGCKNPTITIKLEKVFTSLIIVGKKHYAGLLEGGKFYGKGLDHRKRKTIGITKKLLKGMWDRLLSHRDLPEHFDAWIAKLKQKFLRDPIPEKHYDLFVIHTKVDKEIAEYAPGKALPIHAQIFEDLKKAGREVWLPHVVRYIAVVPDGKRQGNSDGLDYEMFIGSGRELDRVHYWNVEILAKLVRVLEAVYPDWDWYAHDTTIVAQREKFIATQKDRLGDAKSFFKVIARIPKSNLSASQKKEFLAEIPEYLVSLRREELKALIIKRLEKFTNHKEVQLPCDVCSPERPIVHSAGLRVARIHSYDSTICHHCGQETEARIDETKESDDAASI